MKISKTPYQIAQDLKNMDWFTQEIKSTLMESISQGINILDFFKKENTQ